MIGCKIHSQLAINLLLQQRTASTWSTLLGLLEWWGRSRWWGHGLKDAPSPVAVDKPKQNVLGASSLAAWVSDARNQICLQKIATSYGLAIQLEALEQTPAKLYQRRLKKSMWWKGRHSKSCCDSTQSKSTGNDDQREREREGKVLLGWQ